MERRDIRPVHATGREEGRGRMQTPVSLESAGRGAREFEEREKTARKKMTGR